MTTILGTSGDDTLNGAEGEDTVLGLAGNDLLSGHGGDDSLSGGDGNDTLAGGLGVDTLAGGKGDDLLDAGSGGIAADDDLLLPGEGSDTMRGDAGRFASGAGSVVSYEDLGLESDYLLISITGEGTGSAISANSTLVDDAFINIRAIVGSGGADHFEATGPSSMIGWTGYSGDDLFVGNGSVWLRYDREEGLGGTQGVSVDLATGTGTDAFGGSDSISGIDTVTGTSRADIILGDDDDNRLDGLSGNDSLDGRAADDTIFAGEGNDTALGGDGADYVDAGDGNDLVDGGGGSDYLAGRGGNDTLTGGNGGDGLHGGEGNDVLTGGEDCDTLAGGAGADSLDGGAQDDALEGGEGDDTLLGGAGDDRLSGGAGADLIDGGEGLADLLDYGGETGSAGVAVDLATGSATDSHGFVDTVTGIERLAGTAQDDLLRGNASDNVFFGTNGSDSINGGGGRDLLSYEWSAGPTGYDISLLLGTASDGGGGIDALSGIRDVRGSLQSDTITGGSSGNRLEGLSGDDNLIGSGGDDTLIGGRGNDTMSGGSGTDRVIFGPGPFGAYADLGSGLAVDGFGDTDQMSGIENLTGTGVDDTLIGDEAGNSLDGGAGDDFLSGNVGSDVLTGGDGRDSLDGGSGDDDLSGGEGDDLFNGGAGDDTIDGGAGDGDLALYASELAIQGIVVDLASGTVSDGVGGTDIVSGVERIAGTRFGDVFIGNAVSNVFRGLQGDDTIDGGTGGFNAVRYDDGGVSTEGITVRLAEAFVIDQFGDMDTVTNIQSVTGTSLADIIVGSLAAESFSGGDGDDILDGGEGNDTLVGGAGHDQINGGAGFDIADFTGALAGESDSGLRISIADGTSVDPDAVVEHLISIEGATGSEFADTIRGDEQSNALAGGAEDDLLFGELGSPRDVHASKCYRLYRATLDRDPDQKGHDRWTLKLKNGTPLVKVISGFVKSAEFQNEYGTTSNGAFVTLLYNNVLDRDPDPGGFARWKSFLAAGKAREKVVAAFANSIEFQNKTEAASMAYSTSARQCDFSGEIFRLFHAAFDRDPDPGEFAVWTEKLVDGRSLVSVTKAFIGTAEFQDTYGSLGNRKFVTLLYNNVLDRPPDASSLDNWVLLLNKGASRATVVKSLSESSEFIASTTQALEDFMTGSATSEFRDTIAGGSGDDFLAGGIGADEFRFKAGEGGTDTIVDYESWDTIFFEGYGYTDLAGASHLLRQEGEDVIYEDPELTIRILDTELATILS